MKPLMTLLLLSAVSHPVLAQSIRVLTLDQSRTSVCQTVDFNIAVGNAFASVRGLLLSNSNFGPGGIIPRDIELLASVPAITPSALEGADIVLLANAVADAPLTECELRLLGDFVEAGGGVFMFVNNAAAVLGPELGADGGVAASGSATVSNTMNPVTDGPFGQASGTFPMGFHQGFELVGPNGSVFLTSTSDIAASFEFGLGRAVLYCDEEGFLDLTVSPCGANRIFSQTTTMFLNAVAFVTPPTSFSFPGAPGCCPGDIADDFGTLGADGMISFGDFLALLGLIGPCPGGTPGCVGDIADDFGSLNGGDGMVSFGDFLALLGLIGPCP